MSNTQQVNPFIHHAHAKLLAIWLFISAVTIAITGIIVRYWIVTPNVKSSFSLQEYHVATDPLHLADKYFYFALLLLVVGVGLFIYAARIKQQNETEQAGMKYVLSYIPKPTRRISLIYIVTLSLAVFSVGLSGTTWTTVSFAKARDKVTEDMRHSRYLIIRDMEYSKDSVLIIRIIPKRQLSVLTSVLARSGYSNAGSLSMELAHDVAKRHLLAWVFGICAIILAIITGILVRKQYKAEHSSAELAPGIGRE